MSPEFNSKTVIQLQRFAWNEKVRVQDGNRDDNPFTLYILTFITNGN